MRRAPLAQAWSYNHNRECAAEFTLAHRAGGPCVHRSSLGDSSGMDGGAGCRYFTWAYLVECPWRGTVCFNRRHIRNSSE